MCAGAPEVIFQAALGQWLSARHSVKLFHESGHKDWTPRHGFYTNMGGFHLRPPDWQSFPIDAKQLHYLVIHDFLPYPSLGDAHIHDKNKVDGMLRFITLVQTLWFLVNLIVRASQGLAITVLELSTSGSVMFSVAITLCWMKKPADIRHPDYLDTQTELADILRRAGSEAAKV